MSSSINQGGKYNNSKLTLIKQGFKSGSCEGFTGILGSNRNMDNVIARDTDKTNSRVNDLNDSISTYKDNYDKLKTKSDSYINDIPVDTTVLKNYNVFINKITSLEKMPEVNQKGCVTIDSISNLSIADGFDEAYPENFTIFADIKNACKLWAANMGKTVFAINKNTSGKYQCNVGTGLNSTITQNLRPAKLYTVLTGDASAIQSKAPSANSKSPWNIINMTQASLVCKYNSTNYRGDRRGVPAAINARWWGTPNQSGWGKNFFPNDIAWWISNTDYMLYGTMGYFYFVYNASLDAKNIGIYAVVDDSCELKFNGQTITRSPTPGDHGGGGAFNVNLIAGKNVFELKLINTGGPGAFVFYAYDGNTNKVLFKSGDPGWGYTMTPVSDYNLIKYGPNEPEPKVARAGLLGGLFSNGQIGVWGGPVPVVVVDPAWNIANMKKPTYIKKYNSQIYSSSDKPMPGMNGYGWWGNSVPGTRENWGINMFPNHVAWWLGNDGSGRSYFYYLYDNLTPKNIFIYYLCEGRRGDGIKINGQTVNMIEKPKTAVTYNTVGGNGWEGTAALPVGKIVFEINLPSGLPTSGYVIYVTTAEKTSVLFKSGDLGWGVTTTPVSDYNLINNGTTAQSNPTNIKTLNQAPAGYNKCDPIIGGGVNKASISASYGLNCSNVTNPPLNARYVRITPNDKGDYIQVPTLEINAIVNGSIKDVATQGRASAANQWGSYSPPRAINGNKNNSLGYHSATPSRDNYFEVDLGSAYPLTEIIYWNRGDCCSERAIGMKIQLKANDGTVYQPFILTGAMKQSLSVSANRPRQ